MTVNVAPVYFHNVSQLAKLMGMVKREETTERFPAGFNSGCLLYVCE
jgi:hypothetical protein